MQEQLVTLETAKLAKEKGFDFYGVEIRDANTLLVADNVSSRLDYFGTMKDSNLIQLPTQTLLQKWLREERQLYIEVQVQDYVESPKFYWNMFGSYKDSKMIRCIANGPREDYTAYEEALEAGLAEALNTLPDIKK